jgi:hypothetical protein
MKKEHLKNMRIPEKYEAVILDVLAAYPELHNAHIHFLLKRKHSVPYGTVPTPASIFRKPENRVYQISLLEEAEPPTRYVLFDYLTTEMQKGVIAHELIHVLQFRECSRKQLIKRMLGFAKQSVRRKLERAADKGAIEHGFGEELYQHAIYMRSVPGYVEQRPSINTDYLLPHEILEYIRLKKAL